MKTYQLSIYGTINVRANSLTEAVEIAERISSNCERKVVQLNGGIHDEDLLGGYKLKDIISEGREAEYEV